MAVKLTKNNIERRAEVLEYKIGKQGELFSESDRFLSVDTYKEFAN